MMRSLFLVSLLLCLASVEAVFDRVITLGDSYAAGTGVHRKQEDYEDPECWADSAFTPGGRYAETHGIEHTRLSCGGAGVAYARNEWGWLQFDFPDLASNGWNDTLIVVTVGGNDARTGYDENWTSMIIRCVKSLRCHKDSRNQLVNLDSLLVPLREFYIKLVTDAPHATIRILGYPRLFHPPRFVPVCFFPGISFAEAKVLDSQNALQRLKENGQNVTDTYSDVDFKYVDVTQYFTNGACSPFPWRQVHDIRLPDLIPSLHPSRRGYEKYYEALLASL